MAHRAAYAAAVSILVWLVLPAVPAAAGAAVIRRHPGSGTTVEMVDACFTPTVLYVDQTAKLVTFVNRSGMTHNVTANQWGHFDDILDGDVPGIVRRAGCLPVRLFDVRMSGAIVVGGGKGAGSGDAVRVEPVVIPDRPSVADPGATAEVVAAAAPSSNPTIGWLGGGALGLAAGVGIGLTARRRSGAERARDEA